MYLICPEEILGALAVDVAVGRVERLRLVHPLGRLLVVAHVLQKKELFEFKWMGDTRGRPQAKKGF